MRLLKRQCVCECSGLRYFLPIFHVELDSFYFTKVDVLHLLIRERVVVDVFRKFNVIEAVFPSQGLLYLLSTTGLLQDRGPTSSCRVLPRR